MTQRTFVQSAKEFLNKFLQSFDLHHKQDIIVFSHLRWDFIFQRPQYIVSKLAKRNRILYVEEPIPFHPLDRGTTSLFHPQKNITVLQPKIVAEHINQDLPLLIAKQIREQRMKNPVLWFYSPAFRDIISMLNHSLVVYDYLGGKAIYDATRADYLLTTADIVFSSERRFFEKKKIVLKNLYYLPNSVVFSEDVGVRLQRILQKVIAAKNQPTLYTKPFYHPSISQIILSK